MFSVFTDLTYLAFSINDMNTTEVNGNKENLWKALRMPLLKDKTENRDMLSIKGLYSHVTCETIKFENVKPVHTNTLLSYDG